LHNYLAGARPADRDHSRKAARLPALAWRLSITMEAAFCVETLEDALARYGKHVQVKNIWMTVDPYMRGRMVDRASYVPPFSWANRCRAARSGKSSLPMIPGSTWRSRLDNVRLAGVVQCAGGKLAEA
jgi:hypothetical protein